MPKTTKPYAATMKEWDTWKADTKQNKPIWYFFHETLPIKFSRLGRRISDIKYWFVHRTYDKYHVVRTDLKPGYADCDRRMLHVNFTLLVDFIECEKAWMNRICNHDYKRTLSERIFFWRDYRNPEGGLEHLDWEIGLVYDEDSGMEPADKDYGLPTPQALTAKEQKEIYLWYKNIRSVRPDRFDISGWSDICDRERAGEEISDEVKTASCNLSQVIEDTYYKEDEDMLKRLMSIRLSLWT